MPYCVHGCGSYTSRFETAGRGSLTRADCFPASGAGCSAGTTALASERDRASEAAHRQAAAHAVRAQVGEDPAADRTTGAEAGRTGNCKSPARSDVEANSAKFSESRLAETNPTSFTRTSSARSKDLHTQGGCLSRVRWSSAQTGRGCVGGARVPAGAVSCHPAGASEVQLRDLRAHRAGAGTKSPDRAWLGRSWAVSARARRKIQ